MQTDTWHGCYDQQLADVIVPEAFSHPAKMSWALGQRIMGHLQAEWPSVRLVVDPMAGIGTVGLAAAYSGYTAILGELEGHFADLCAQNIAKHGERLRALGKPVPLLFRHDARAMPLGGADAVVTSPPYGDIAFRPPSERDKAQRIDVSRPRGTYANGFVEGNIYGSHPAQLGNLRAVVTSPPFGDIVAPHGAMQFRFREITGNLHRKAGHISPSENLGTYGSHPAQLGNLRAVVTSPPYGDIAMAGGHRQYVRAEYGENGKAKPPSPEGDYGSHQAQMGNDSGSDYWSAIAKVYLECARILPPGAPMVLVVKGYVSKGAYIDLPMQTAQLVDSCGFEVVHWHNASLVARESQLGLFGGEERKSRKSFFRRLAEKNGAPPIDAEIVLCAVRR